MKKLILLILFLVSCNNNSDLKPQVIAYYAGDEKSIDEFDLNGVDQIIYSFLHLKENKLAIDDIKDSLTLVNIVNQKKNYPKLKVLVSLGGWGG
ncbi:glycosyl hydrolase family 18 protein, partial [Flavobacteriaceae bacterium]|nr:glycosyl hydrolase family 18 protein [Flavobacteriaceae bacterium]